MIRIEQLKKLINEAKNQPLAIYALNHASQNNYNNGFRYKTRGHVSGYDYDAFLNSVCQTYHVNKKPASTSPPLKYVFKIISEEEYRTGKLTDKNRKKIIDIINRRRGEIKEKLKKNPKDKKAISELARLKVSIYRSLYKTLTSIFKATPPRSRTPIKKAIKEFSSRSKLNPITITSNPLELAYSDYIGGKLISSNCPFSGENSDDIFTIIQNGNRAIAYTGSGGPHKTARAIIGRFRKFKRGEGSMNAMLPYIAIIDIQGPIRQQKHIVRTLLNICKTVNMKLFIPKEFKHRFRCDLKFGNKEKIIDSYDFTISEKYSEFIGGSRPGFQPPKKPAYPGGVSYITKSVNMNDRLTYIIPEALEVERKLNPDEFKDESAESVPVLE